MRRNSKNHPPLAWRRRTTKSKSYNQNDEVQSLQQNPFKHLIGFQNQCGTSVGKGSTPQVRTRIHTYKHYASPQLAESGRRIIQEQYAYRNNDLSPNIAWGVSPAHATSATSVSTTRSATEILGNKTKQVTRARTFKSSDLDARGFGEPRGFGTQWIGMSIASCVLNTKTAVKKQPSRPVVLKPKTKSYPHSGRGLVQRLRSLTSSAPSDTQKRDNSHARVVPISRATNEEKTKCTDHPPMLLLGTQSAKLQRKRKIKVKPKHKVPQTAKSAAKPDNSAQIEEEKRQQELFQKRTQERVASALRAKKELRTQQELRMQEAKKRGPDPVLLVKKTQERLAAFKAKAAESEILATNAKKKHSNVDVAEQREKARLRAKQFAKLRKNDIKDQKKKELENKLRKQKLRQERIEQRELRRARIYAINAIMLRWNQNQMQKFDDAKAAQASKAIPETDKASTAIPETDEASTAIPETDEASTAIPETDEASTAIPETDKASTAIPETDEASTAIPEIDEASTAIPETDEASTAIPEIDEAITEADEAITEADEASKAIRETNESGNTIVKTADVSESTSKASISK